MPESSLTVLLVVQMAACLGGVAAVFAAIGVRGFAARCAIGG